MTPDASQQKALDMAKSEPVMILTGGPGTGKTFTINHILRDAAGGMAPNQIALAAPTGKAAKRMHEATGHHASTLHRLLRYSPVTGGFEHNRMNPLPYKLIVVDESSMIDILLMRDLMAAVSPDSQLIMVGDKDQLPSVGPGNVLRDMIASSVLPVAELDTIHRQSEHSWISINARKINHGEFPVCDDARSDDFFAVFHNDARRAREAVITLATDKARELDINPFKDVQVLCPQRKGVLGVEDSEKQEGLNKALQAVLNPPNGAGEYFGFRERDKVIHTRNNYELEVFNGETGVIDYASKMDRCLVVDYGDREVRYEKEEDLFDLKLAYAMTIHKSQGSEWPMVVLAIHWTNQFMLNRNLFYTGLTRGKARVELVTCERGLKKAIRNKGASQRNTMLAQALRGVFGKGKTS